MAQHMNLDEIKTRVAAPLMAIDGVSGVGVGDGGIHVYLDSDHEAVHSAVSRVMSAEAAGAPFQVIVSGGFHAQ